MHLRLEILGLASLFSHHLPSRTYSWSTLEQLSPLSSLSQTVRLQGPPHCRVTSSLRLQQAHQHYHGRTSLSSSIFSACLPPASLLTEARLTHLHAGEAGISYSKEPVRAGPKVLGGQTSFSEVVPYFGEASQATRWPNPLGPIS